MQLIRNPNHSVQRLAKQSESDSPITVATCASICASFCTIWALLTPCKWPAWSTPR